jgi:hypothetical protein
MFGFGTLGALPCLEEGMKNVAIFVAVTLAAAMLRAQEPQDQPSPQGDLSAATQAMSHHHHEGHEHMDTHMHMSALRDPQPGDQEKAQEVVDEVRQAIDRYRDSKAALADGFEIFLPNVPQKMYHFTKREYAIGAAFYFDPTKPTSLLYEKRGSDYKLIGAMYTAPVRFSEDDLNQRIPLSVAQWHQHVNLCRPPKGREIQMLAKNPKFGLNGSISTREACAAAGGTFMPHVFGWMVHVYPWEKTSDNIWSVERQLTDKPGTEHQHDHAGMGAMQHEH